jgi:hypothetical protein
MKVIHTVDVHVHLRLNAEGVPSFLVTTFAGMEEFYGKSISVCSLEIEYDYREAVIYEIETLQKEAKALEVEVPHLTEEERKIVLAQRQGTAQALKIILAILPVEHKPQACASAQKPCPIHSSEGDYPL